MPEHDGPPSRPRPPFNRPDEHRPRRWVQTWSPSDRTGRVVVALNDVIVGCWTHFLKGAEPSCDRTVPCLRYFDACANCPLVRNRRWKGFLGAALQGARRPVLLEITEGCWESSDDLQRLDGELRGWTWRASREQDGRRARMVMRKQLTLLTEPALPRVDVLSVLSRMWQLERPLLVKLTATDEGAGGWGDPNGTEFNDANGPAPHLPDAGGQPAPRGEWKRLREADDRKRRGSGS